ncbi:MAG: hypothetical protein K2X86_10015, partial [Cytophagaceae bacterium]|nr:hypothetical protein [Cytophagaceae bacterium]
KYKNWITNLGGQFAPEIGGQLHRIFHSERYISNFLVVNTQFFSPVSVKDTFNYNESIRTVYETYYDSLLVDGVWFKEVRLFNNLYQEASSLPKYIYYSKNVGIIRKELFKARSGILKDITSINNKFLKSSPHEKNTQSYSFFSVIITNDNSRRNLSWICRNPNKGTSSSKWKFHAAYKDGV